MTKEERIQQAYEVYEQQLAAVDKQAEEARKFHRESLMSVLKTIRESYPDQNIKVFSLVE